MMTVAELKWYVEHLAASLDGEGLGQSEDDPTFDARLASALETIDALAGTQNAKKPVVRPETETTGEEG